MLLVKICGLLISLGDSEPFGLAAFAPVLVFQNSYPFTTCCINSNSSSFNSSG
ncbi:MAG: hypothetical protein DKINENOH_00280 [bacterium]|nr:hypothetical protein [bacterium]